MFSSDVETDSGVDRKFFYVKFSQSQLNKKVYSSHGSRQNSNKAEMFSFLSNLYGL